MCRVTSGDGNTPFQLFYNKPHPGAHDPISYSLKYLLTKLAPRSHYPFESPPPSRSIPPSQFPAIISTLSSSSLDLSLDCETSQYMCSSSTISPHAYWGSPLSVPSSTASTVVFGGYIALIMIHHVRKNELAKSPEVGFPACWGRVSNQWLSFQTGLSFSVVESLGHWRSHWLKLWKLRTFSVRSATICILCIQFHTLGSPPGPNSWGVAGYLHLHHFYPKVVFFFPIKNNRNKQGKIYIFIWYS